MNRSSLLQKSLFDFLTFYKQWNILKLAVLCWSSREEIPHAQGKRNPSKMVGVARGHQRADTLKPYSQKSSQSNHTMTHPSWVALLAWFSFIELDKAVVLV